MAQAEVSIEIVGTEIFKTLWGRFAIWCLQKLPAPICPAFVVALKWHSSNRIAFVTIRPTYRPGAYKGEFVAMIKKERAEPKDSGGN